jgi:hypothetical protein
MDRQTAFTHIGMLPTCDAARECADELSQDGFRTVLEPVDHSPHDLECSLHATKNVAIKEVPARNAYVQAVFQRHGGDCDGGHAGWPDSHVHSWPTNTMPSPPGWQHLTDTDGVDPQAWHTTANNGMRTVVHGSSWRLNQPAFEDDDLDGGPPEPHPGPPVTPERTAALAPYFHPVYHVYVFPDVDPSAGPVTHPFSNIDFTGGDPAPLGDTLLARTLGGLKPAAALPADTDPEYCVIDAQEAGLGVVPFGRDRLWLSPPRLADRVDRDLLAGTWQSLLDADPDTRRRDLIAAAVERGLAAAFALDLLQPLPRRPRLDRGLPHAWWNPAIPEGLVTIGAVLGYPPAAMYSQLTSLHDDVPLAIPTPVASDLHR